MIFLTPLSLALLSSYFVFKLVSFEIGVSYLLLTICLIVAGSTIVISYTRAYENAYRKIEEHFLTYELLDLEALKQILNFFELRKSEEIIQLFLNEKKIQKINLSNGQIYRWTANSSFKKGVIRRTIQLN